MEIAEHIEVLRHEGELLSQAAADAGLTSEVATCPGWQVRDLLGHTGRVHRWATFYVTTGSREPRIDAATAASFAAPDDRHLVDWFRTGHAALVIALAAADPDLACFTFLPAPSPLAFWARRQAHETAIHRVDAESTGTAHTTFASPFAADGIDELLTGILSRPGGTLVADPPVSLAVAATDIDAAWTVRIEPDHIQVLAGRNLADLTVTGPADDLYLLLWNRGDTRHCDVRGSIDVLDLWNARARIG
jgi:uncharacterized protein (TIGR03083 family)